MVRKRLTLLVIGFSLILAGRLIAHHSEAAEFDATRPVKVTGAIKRVQWQNPHVWFYVDETDANGRVTTWGFTTQPPGALMRRGITKDALILGAVVTVEGNRARDGSNNASTRSLKFADGRDVLAAPAGAPR